MAPKYIKILLISFLSTVILTSCGSKTQVAQQQYVTPQPEHSWTTLYASVDLNMSRPMSMNFSTRATMENGKYIHLSMRFIGMEVAAMYMDNDSVFFVDKYHKYMFAEPLQTVLGQQYKHLTISDIQQLFLGQQTLPANDRIDLTPTDFVETQFGQIASLIKIDAHTPQGTILGSAKWKPTSAKWDETNRKADFKVPSGYKRIRPENLESMLKSMSM